MTFFYDLNKRLADLAKKQDLTESVQSEAKTKRLPGLPITQKDVEKKFGGSMIKMAQAAKEAGFSDARIAQAMDDLKQGKNPNDVAEADYSAKKAAAGKDIGKPGKMFSKIAKSAGKEYGSKAAGERVAGAVLNKLRAKESVDKDEVDESALQAYIGDKKYGKKGMDALRKAGREGASKDKMSQIRNRYNKMDEADMEEGNEFSGELVKARAQGAKEFKVDGKSYPVKEGGMPMTPKQKSFAKLAPPANKITFADKIAGAKKEVDEMLGDVAAEAIKGAVGKKKEPRSKGTAFDPEVLKTMTSTDPHPRYDVKDTGYSKRYTRKVQDEPADDTEVDTGPKKKGRPKGPDRGPERVTAKSYKYKAGRPGKAMEGNMDPADSGEYDREGDMAKEQMHTIMSAAKELHRILRDDENLPEWVQKKITLAKEYIDTARDYMLTQHAERAEEEPIAEKAVSKKQQRFMGMAHAMQKGEKIKGAGSELKKVAKTMKKGDVEDFAKTKHNGLPEKAKAKKTEGAKPDFLDVDKDGDKKEPMKKAAGEKKEKKVEETSTESTSSKGGYNFGGGVYESLNRKFQQALTEGMNVSVNMSTGQDGNPTKNITISADGEDADKLADLLKMAGLGDQEQACSTCGSTPCGCNTEIAEDSSDVEYSEDDEGNAVWTYNGHEFKLYGDYTDGEGFIDNKFCCSYETSDEGYRKFYDRSMKPMFGGSVDDDSKIKEFLKSKFSNAVQENSPDWPTNTETSDNAMQYSGGLNGPKSTGQSTTPVLASQLRRQVSMEEGVKIERSLLDLYQTFKTK